MNKNLKVFILEDLKTDQELIKRQVLKFAQSAVFTVASSGMEFKEKINWSVPDIILSDYQLPDYNGLKALLYVKEKMPHIPFVFITGLLNNEEVVAETVLQGAAGYILKDNLRDIPEKLPTIIENAKAILLAEERHRNEARRKSILLQKITALVQQSGNFEKKEAVLAALEEIEEMGKIAS